MKPNKTRGLAVVATLIAGVALPAIAALAIALSSGAALAQDATQTSPDDLTNVWDIARGGQLYDNWMNVLEADEPVGNSPAYPATGKKSGPDTWRCKECHGWDFKGKDGAYSSGSHFTGIIGVRGAVGMDINMLQEIIMDDTHGYTDAQIPQSAVEKLALFLSEGQIDTDRYIDSTSKMARGNPARGASFYQTICAVCHSFDGKAMNFGNDAEPEYVGTVAAGNPWEALHKIRFGQPGVGMIALTALDMDTLVDILAYTQTLPTE